MEGQGWSPDQPGRLPLSFSLARALKQERPICDGLGDT